jgi:hypothetical protein
MFEKIHVRFLSQLNILTPIPILRVTVTLTSTRESYS